jgi:NAD-dependent DNA ligase
MEELKTFLIKAKDEYYKGNPIIPDEVYDRLEEQVGVLNVGSSEGVRIPHMFPMYSLQKIYEGEKDPHKVYKQWAETTPKLDGAAISLLYVDGCLNMALTRGDGKKGLDITDKVRHLVPNTIFSTQAKQITGEIVAPKDIPNARNYAAGALNLKDLTKSGKET